MAKKTAKSEAIPVSGLQFFYDKVKNSDSLSSKELKDLYNKAKMIDESLEFKKHFSKEVYVYPYYRLITDGEDGLSFELCIPIENNQLDSDCAFLKIEGNGDVKAFWDNGGWLCRVGKKDGAAIKTLFRGDLEDGTMLSEENCNVVIELLGKAYDMGLLSNSEIKIY